MDSDRLIGGVRTRGDWNERIGLEIGDADRAEPGDSYHRQKRMAIFRHLERLFN